MSVKRKIDEDFSGEIKRLQNELRSKNYLVDDLQSSIQEKTDEINALSECFYFFEYYINSRSFRFGVFRKNKFFFEMEYPNSSS